MRICVLVGQEIHDFLGPKYDSTKKVSRLNMAFRIMSVKLKTKVFFALKRRKLFHLGETHIQVRSAAYTAIMSFFENEITVFVKPMKF